ncbi:putative RNA 2'-phosphotransferase [Nocardiopsis arvandica]|uniref:Probable RNA 2'-phosphotransferase n=1 Tax=Nocardiopsis sinuspersici TaxID=501010 RepID=A0A7Y9XB55_9ACTN|nr:RNA 2'-phosphotransferase [Nocardiopsis sinuspersici]NYH52536.1 putative RNA 2'-phosphotransferase [Nocardiopsis sinuspersici]
MNQRELVRASRFLSRVLRHDPGRAGIRLDPQGWVGVDELLAGCRRSGTRLDRAALQEIVDTNDKKRFVLSADGDRVRARQGHSVDVDLGLEPRTPPALLHHGTVGRFLPAIATEGLRPMKRHDVHLSPDVETARTVGARRGTPVVLTVAAGRMHDDGHVFRMTGNGVWLVAAVPPEYLGEPVGHRGTEGRGGSR